MTKKTNTNTEFTKPIEQDLNLNIVNPFTGSIRTDSPSRPPDGIIRGKDVDYMFWLGEDGESAGFKEATPEELAKVDEMFDGQITQLELPLND